MPSNGNALDNVYDADAQVAALRRARIKVGGRIYECQILSSEQVAPYFASLDALLVLQEEDDRASSVNSDRELVQMAERMERVNRALRPLLRAVFPRPRIRLAFWRPDPVKAILALPPAVRTDWLQDFFVCVRSWLQTSIDPKAPSSDSGAST